MKLSKIITLGVWSLSLCDSAWSTSKFSYEGDADKNPLAWRQFNNHNITTEETIDIGAVKPMDTNDSDEEDYTYSVQVLNNLVKNTNIN